METGKKEKKAVMESVRFKYCFKKEVNNENNNRNDKKPQQQIVFIKCFLDDRYNSTYSAYVIMFCNSSNKTEIYSVTILFCIK